VAVAVAVKTRQAHLAHRAVAPVLEISISHKPRVRATRLPQVPRRAILVQSALEMPVAVAVVPDQQDHLAQEGVDPAMAEMVAQVIPGSMAWYMVQVAVADPLPDPAALVAVRPHRALATVAAVAMV